MWRVKKPIPYGARLSFHYRVYCIVETVLEIGQMEAALNQAKKESDGSYIKGRSRALHRILNEIASNNQYCLRLRK